MVEHTIQVLRVREMADGKGCPHNKIFKKRLKKQMESWALQPQDPPPSRTASKISPNDLKEAVNEAKQ